MVESCLLHHFKKTNPSTNRVRLVGGFCFSAYCQRLRSPSGRQGVGAAGRIIDQVQHAVDHFPELANEYGLPESLIAGTTSGLAMVRRQFPGTSE